MLRPASRHSQTTHPRQAFRYTGVLLCASALIVPVLSVGKLFGQTPTSIPQAQSVPTAPPHEPKREEREQIETLEDQFRKAQLAGDVAAMDKLLSDDYLGINANGEVSTKTQQLDHIRNRTMVITKFVPSDQKIKLIGSTAIVTSVVQVEGQLDGTSMQGRYRYTRIYQRLPSGLWKVTSFEATRIQRPNQQQGK